MRLPTFSAKDAEKMFFTSDTHFNHKNIIEFCNRPFQDEYYMNEALIENWNKVVPKDGIVFHAGDFIMSSNIESLKSIVERLNGRIYLTFGNHDYQNRLDREITKKLFFLTDDMFYITIEDDELESKHANFQICHFPFAFWRRGYYMLHGHIHSGPVSASKDKLVYHPMRYDVGVDNNQFTPKSYHQLKVLFTKNAMNE